jgi:hypothetical protein
VVQHLPSTWDALGSIPGTKKEKTKKQQKSSHLNNEYLKISGLYD